MDLDLKYHCKWKSLSYNVCVIFFSDGGRTRVLSSRESFTVVLDRAVMDLLSTVGIKRVMESPSNC